MVHTDMNMLSVLDYAVNVLSKARVIVCGHYGGCGGVKAAMGNQSIGVIDNWIRHKDVYRLHNTYLDSIQDEKQSVSIPL
jgi:carbonic anhydrase